MYGAEDSGRMSAGLMKHNSFLGRYARVLNQQDFYFFDAIELNIGSAGAERTCRGANHVKATPPLNGG